MILKAKETKTITRLQAFLVHAYTVLLNNNETLPVLVNMGSLIFNTKLWDVSLFPDLT